MDAWTSPHHICLWDLPRLSENCLCPVTISPWLLLAVASKEGGDGKSHYSQLFTQPQSQHAVAAQGCSRDLGGTRHPWRRGWHQLAQPSRCTSCRQPTKSLRDSGSMANKISILLSPISFLRCPFLALVSHGETPPASSDGCKESGRAERDGAKFPWAAQRVLASSRRLPGQKKKKKWKRGLGSFYCQTHGNCPGLLPPSSPNILAAPSVLSGTSKPSISQRKNIQKYLLWIYSV